MKKRLFPVLFVLPLLLITCSLPSLSISGKAGFPVIAPADYSTDQIYSDLAAELQTFVDGESVKDVALVRHLLNPLDEIERPLIHVGGTASYQLTAEDMNFATSTKPGYGITVPDLGAAFALLSISTSDVVAVSITISYVVEPAFTWPPGGFRRGLVRTGRLVFRPVLPASWVLPPPEIDLSGAAVVLKTAGKEDQALTLQKDTGGGVWYSSLDGKTLYSGTKVRITGTVNFPSGLLVPDDGFYVLHIKAVPEIGELSEVALTGSFRDDTVSFEVPVGIHSVNFNKVGIRFILNYPIEGLVYRVKIPALTLEEEVKTGSRGQKAEVVDYNKDLFVRADNNGSAPYFLNAAINIGPGDDPDFAGEYDAEMVVYDVAPGATLNITAKPEFIFDIERARLNLHKVLAGSRPDIYPIGKIPNDDIGLDINELLEPYDKFFKAENVVFNDINAAFFVRGYDDFLSGAKVKLWPSESPNYLNLDRDGSGYSFFNTSSAPLSPETLGTSFTGTLPAGLIRFDFDEIQKILRARPPNLFLHYDVRLPDNPVTLEFDEDT
ncbi:MAG: hypothetical protein LBI67_02120, partial [Treponema sp.]|nr:hypothetical protein [Treponema sp.]